MGFWDQDAIAAAEETRTDFSPIPAGAYTAIITDAEVKTSKAGGNYVNVRWDITGPEYKGRVLFDIINVQHSNPTVVGIGLGQIKTLCSAAGAKGEKYYEALKAAANWQEAEAMLNQLHSVVGNIPMELQVVIEDNEKYGPQNRIKRVKPPTAQEAAPAAQGKKADKGKMPWD